MNSASCFSYQWFCMTLVRMVRCFMIVVPKMWRKPGSPHGLSVKVRNVLYTRRGVPSYCECRRHWSSCTSFAVSCRFLGLQSPIQPLLIKNNTSIHLSISPCMSILATLPLVRMKSNCSTNPTILAYCHPPNHYRLSITRLLLTWTWTRHFSYYFIVSARRPSFSRALCPMSAHFYFLVPFHS